MLRALVALVLCLTALPGFSQSKGKYQVGTITAVERYRGTNNAASDPIGYDVSIRVVDTIYVVRYTPEFGLNTVEYAAGRELLVLVGEKTITCNDLMGRAHDLPIVSQTTGNGS